MGSPLGPSFSNICMCALEQNFLSNCPSNYKPIFYRRFVDDTFCIFENRTQVECFLKYLNGQHPNIKFTHELEEDNSLPFLDILATHVENGFATNLYRKKTFTCLYTHFDSLSPIQYKINLISVLIYRAFQICSSYMAFHSQICNIKRFLQQNRIPSQLIDRIIKSFLNKKCVVDIKPKIAAFELWCYRRLLRISWVDKRTNQWVLEKTGPCRRLLDKINERKLKFLGHIARTSGITKDLPFGTVIGKRGLGRPKNRMSGNVKNIANISMASL